MVGQELLQRLQFMKVEPEHVLDLGCGVGKEARALATSYPQAQVYGMDLAFSFVEEARKEADTTVKWVVADGQILPLRADSVDLIFANLLLPWIKDYHHLLREWRRVLRPQGLLLFSSLGPATFKEWTATEERTVLPALIDMHHIGDALVEAGFADPILETEELTFTYPSLVALTAELEKTGMFSKATKVLTVPACENLFPLSFEVVYGHAWSPSVKGFKPDSEGVVKIPLSQLKK